MYVIYAASGRVVHVGRTPRASKGIYQRLRNHMSNQSSFCAKYLKGAGGRLSRQRFTFRYVVVSSPRQRALLEMFAIGSLCPAHLGVG